MLILPMVGNSLIGFLSESLVFFSKKWAIRSFARFLVSSLMVAHFWWATWVNRSFLVSNLSDLLISLIKKRGNEQIANVPKNTILVNFFLAKRSFFCERKSEWAICSEKSSNLFICSFIMSDLSESLTVTHLSWATWSICSRLLFWHEWPERFAHSCSFVLRDLSESFTVAHLIWPIWANEQMSDEPMSEFPTLILPALCHIVKIP